MDLISIIVIIVIISKIMKKAGAASDKVQRFGEPENVWDQMASSNKQYDSAQRKSYSSKQSEQWQKMARENIEKARRRAEEKLREVDALGEMYGKKLNNKKADYENTYQMPKQNVRTTPAYEQITLQQAQKELRTRQNEAYKQSMQHRQQENKSAAQQIHAGRVEAKNTSILERAVKNADEDKIDVTLTTMEAEHNHSERVSPAEHYHPEDVIPENMLGNIEDLMIKGYDGNLCFERDFIGEAMDMISRFTVPSDIPDFSFHGKDIDVLEN